MLAAAAAEQRASSRVCVDLSSNFIIHNHATQIVKGYYEISRRAILLFLCCSSGASEINMQIIELFCVREYMEFR